ncbi:hypothetical protein GCM10008022_14160 [Paenibacillus hunanensis]|uniref:ATPase subunit of ABC transporter with duplicated ATPase domains n=1 Tax=Paenibacillus hunanensis TaxID=539262 RepID=A0ABU1ISL9_9BACL|nr:ATPase subunit of ABC transporter with duplicated ATPase domains [Paenibacillus hunanensis]GGJ06295.1 hypothetical protein GCM10008022_14160 [Paenibacillus hunanensis]
MSILLNVEKLSHGFGDQTIFKDISFRILRGEHVGLISANSENKSMFTNMITGKLKPDEGKVEWSKRIRVGYLDQHAVLEKGMTIRHILKSAFQYLIAIEHEMNNLYSKMGDVAPEKLEDLLEQVGTIQDTLTAQDFYQIDAKIDETARGLGLTDIGLDKDVNDLSGEQRTRVLLTKLLLEKPDILLLDEPTHDLDEVHITWLTRYLQEYENAFILISHDIPFLNSVINVVYHIENQELNRYVGDYNHFLEVYEMKKQQMQAASKREDQRLTTG